MLLAAASSSTVMLNFWAMAKAVSPASTA